MSCRICRRRATRSSCAATGWWIRRASLPSLGSTGSQGGRRARRTRGRAGLSGQLLAEPPRDPQGRTCPTRNSPWKPRRASRAIRWARVRRVRSRRAALASMLDAWDRHTAMGPNGANMSDVFKGLGEQRKAFADWTDRIAAGAYPEAPPRPVGVERNLVISMWDWALPTSRRSDAAATDERNPTLNANGLVYGAIQSSDILAVLDPRTNATSADQDSVERPGARRQHAGISVLGERKDLAAAGRPSQRRDGCERTRLGDRADPRAAGSAGVSARTRRRTSSRSTSRWKARARGRSNCSTRRRSSSR